MKNQHEVLRLNKWQRGVPVYNAPIFTRTFSVLLAIGAAGLSLALIRLFNPLGAFSGMTDVYAWGVWKTFNVMTLTALGSGGLAVGIAVWVFNQKQLHHVMRVALVTSFVFYTSGIVALTVDVGRPWNLFWTMLPWEWNIHSPLLEVAICMPAYAFLFLAYENGPLVAEKLWYDGSNKTRKKLWEMRPVLRRIYPYMIATAYLLPMMHQSSLGALLLLSGPKLHPLWQSPTLPFMYLIQAGICGFAFVIFILLASCYYWRRAADMNVLGKMGKIMSGVILAWIAFRFIDLAVRGHLATAFQFDFYTMLFWFEIMLVLIPAVVLRYEAFRRSPQILFQMALLTCIGGMTYRFVPTTIAYKSSDVDLYFPTVPEIIIMAGLVALALAAYAIAVKKLAILPAPLKSWYGLVEHTKKQNPKIKRDEHGNPIED